MYNGLEYMMMRGVRLPAGSPINNSLKDYMKIEELFEVKNASFNFLLEKEISTANATLSFNWKKDLDEEESENYLPPGYDYDKVLELSLIQVTGEIGKGFGKEIFQKFLKTPEVRKAQLIFLDLSPDEGDWDGLTEEEIFTKLESIYKSWGFRNRHKFARMWLVLQGSIADKDLPT